MMSRLRLTLAAALIAACMIPATGLALEKTAVVARDVDHPGVWRGGTTCTVSYYNTCTGWLWVWDGWNPNDRVGVAFTSCCPGGSSTAVDEVYIYAWTGAPAGYGFTGTVDVWAADGDLCPTGPSLAQSPWLPASGFLPISLGGVTIPGDNFAISFTGGPGLNSPVSYPSDHPAAGATGPQSCGACYPTTRVTRSFYWGTPASPLCPGSSLSDGICDAEMFWDVTVSCTTPVTPTSWGAVKNMYR